MQYESTISYSKGFILVAKPKLLMYLISDAEFDVLHITKSESMYFGNSPTFRLTPFEVLFNSVTGYSISIKGKEQLLDILKEPETVKVITISHSSPYYELLQKG